MRPAPTPITSDTALFTLYDIESLNNVFTISAYTPKWNRLDVFFLIDIDDTPLIADESSQVARAYRTFLNLGDQDPASKTEQMSDSIRAEIVAAIKKENPALVAAHPDGTAQQLVVKFHDLRTLSGNESLALMMGLSSAKSVNDPALADPDVHNDNASSFERRFRPVCDTDTGVYDPVSKHPFLMGYNSNNYDVTMTALYLHDAFSFMTATSVRNDPNQESRLHFAPVRAASIRAYNDELFSADFIDYMPRFLTQGSVAGRGGWDSLPNRIRQAMINSGRHIDASNFNEAQRKVALKRLLGGLGRQVLESDKLDSSNATIHTFTEFVDLIAYNVSDVVGLHKLFLDPVYASTFDLKAQLVQQYPEVVYNAKRGTEEPDIRPNRVRHNRLTYDTTSAKLVAAILAPYKPLNDIPAVSFMYPSERIARERGIEQVNVLEEAKKFFYDNVEDAAARAAFDEIYEYYHAIEGENFNDSETQTEAFAKLIEPYQATRREGNPALIASAQAQIAPLLRQWTKDEATIQQILNGSTMMPFATLATIPKRANNIPYFYRDGTPSTCFATFSTGGIHGAEASANAFNTAMATWKEQCRILNAVQEIYPDPLDMRKARTVTLPDTGEVIEYQKVLTSKTTIKALTEKNAALAALGDDPSDDEIAAIEKRYAGHGYRPLPARPALFKGKKDAEKNNDFSTKLDPKYTYTSAELAIHEDFTSYYPNLLRNMSAFYNPALGEDRYALIFEDKERYGREMKQPGLSKQEIARLGVLRGGTKLLLNAASGAGDMTMGKSTIRMNNQIISMRLMGQIFSWRIAQAQTLHGARIISTNTDGLYSVLDEEINNRVLAEESAAINVEIEPEPLLLVSKDANNRLEMDVPEDGTPLWEAPIIGAGGGSLACHEGPQPTKSLAHPAVLDWALARYLRYIAGGYIPMHRNEPLSLAEPMDMAVAVDLMKRAITENEPVLAARLFQNLIVASRSSISYPFAHDVDPTGEVEDLSTLNPRPLQHVNRVFVVTKGLPEAVSLRVAGAWAKSSTSKGRARTLDPVAAQILRHNGFGVTAVEANQDHLTLLPPEQDIAVRKITGVDASWSMVVENRDLVELAPTELTRILENLDLRVYVQMLADTYEENWMNKAGNNTAFQIAL